MDDDAIDRAWDDKREQDMLGEPDPYPWVVRVKDRLNPELIAARDGERLASPLWVTFWDSATEDLIWSPRGEGEF